jgi:hypothetical protein
VRRAVVDDTGEPNRLMFLDMGRDPDLLAGERQP